MAETADDFEAAFAEFSKDESEENIASSEDLGDAQDPAVGEEGSGNTATDGPQDSGDNAGQGGQEPPAEPTIEDLKRERDEWRHRFQSDQGRISALQRKINELSDARSVQTPASQQPTQGEIKDALQSESNWNEFAENYPDIANAVANQIKSQKDQIFKEVSQWLEPIRQSQEDHAEVERSRFLEYQYNELGRRHPDYVEVAHSDAFKQWVGNQRPHIQAMYNSSDFRDADYLISHFKAERGQPAQQGRQVNDIRQARENRLANSAAPSTRPSPSVRNQIPTDDFEAAFQAYAARSDRRRA